jgi:hypothetical protein
MRGARRHDGVDAPRRGDQQVARRGRARDDGAAADARERHPQLLEDSLDVFELTVVEQEHRRDHATTSSQRRGDEEERGRRDGQPDPDVAR